MIVCSIGQNCDGCYGACSRATVYYEPHFGHWNRNDYSYGSYMECSNCKSDIWTIGEFASAEIDGLNLYCPHCGARMVNIND